jgi:hypothetical protein
MLLVSRLLSSLIRNPLASHLFSRFHFQGDLQHSLPALTYSAVPTMSDTVTIEQRLLKVEELFVYRIPPMKTADGHRAELWGLAKPLMTCSLIVNRRGDTLCLNIMAERPKPNAPAGATETYSFAQSVINVDLSKPGNQLEHWVAAVVDSSRYFALRIRDPKTGREAFIGIGFRERLDATNFRMSMEDYVNSLKREMKAKQMHEKFEQSEQEKSAESGVNEPLGPSQFSLQEGEKIHVNIKSKTPRKRQPNSNSGTGLIGLRPPPPPDIVQSSTDEKPTANSNIAAAGTTDDGDDDEWGDFEG